MDGDDKIVVMMTADDRDVAEKIARGLLEGRKAACVGVFPKGASYYWWKGSIETAEEFLLIAKTKRGLLDDLVAAVKRLHGYEVPEIIALPIVGGSEDYIAWLDDELKGEGAGMREQIEKVLAEEVSPMLATHGGGAELIDVTDDGIVKVKLSGACAGCPGAQMTLTNVVESAIKAKVPEVKRVESIF